MTRTLPYDPENFNRSGSASPAPLPSTVNDAPKGDNVRQEPHTHSWSTLIYRASHDRSSVTAPAGGGPMTRRERLERKLGTGGTPMIAPTHAPPALALHYVADQETYTATLILHHGNWPGRDARWLAITSLARREARLGPSLGWPAHPRLPWRHPQCVAISPPA